MSLPDDSCGYSRSRDWLIDQQIDRLHVIGFSFPEFCEDIGGRRHIPLVHAVRLASEAATEDSSS